MTLQSAQIGTPNSKVIVNAIGVVTVLPLAYSSLTDAASIAINFATSQNFKLATSRSTITFTFSNQVEGDYRDISLVLTGTSLVLTFPANTLCVNSDGTKSGDNTCTLSGTSGDKYRIAISVEDGGNYVVLANNVNE